MSEPKVMQPAIRVVMMPRDTSPLGTPHETVRVTQAEVVYVAVDAPGHPIPVK